MSHMHKLLMHANLLPCPCSPGSGSERTTNWPLSSESSRKTLDLDLVLPEWQTKLSPVRTKLCNKLAYGTARHARVQCMQRIGPTFPKLFRALVEVAIAVEADVRPEQLSFHPTLAGAAPPVENVPAKLAGATAPPNGEAFSTVATHRSRLVREVKRARLLKPPLGETDV